MAKSLKLMFEDSIQLAFSVLKTADEAAAFKVECDLIKDKTEELAQLLHWFSPENIEYDRPFHRVMTNVVEVLLKVLSLVKKCATSNRLLLLVSSSGFTKILLALENCFIDLQWLRALLQSERIHRYSIPSIADKEPSLAMIWSLILELYDSSPDSWGDAALELLTLCRDNDWKKKLIIQEGGVLPLLKVLKHGATEDQECAAKMFWHLGCDTESVEHIIDAGVFSVFAKILKDGPMKVQAEVASAVFKLTEVHPRCQDICVQTNIVRLLINHLSFGMIQDHTQNFIPINKATSVLAMVRASSHSNNKEIVDYNEDRDHKYSTKQSLSNESFKNRQLEDPLSKSLMKAEAAKALWQLVKGNITICQIIIESRALMCFISTLLTKGPEDVQYASIMALMEITAIAEQDADLRRSIFKPSSPSWKAIVDILSRTIQRGTDFRLLIPSVKAIGNLARTFRASNLTIISSLVDMIDESETEVVLEVLNALQKFCNGENHLHLDNCKAIISVGGVRRLVRLASIEESTQPSSSALVILSKIARNVPGDKELVDAGVQTMLKHAPR